AAAPCRIEGQPYGFAHELWIHGRSVGTASIVAQPGLKPRVFQNSPDNLHVIPSRPGYWLVTAGVRSNGRVRRTMPAWPVFGVTTSSLPWCRSRILWLTISPSPSPTLRVV